jgi:hypothetical protein
LSPDAFYLQDLPTRLQQGDIADGVPLILVPPLNSLVLIRQQHHRLPIEHLEPGETLLVDERAVNDAFELGSEYAAVSVIRALAILATPTCDLDQPDGVWMVWPIRPIEGSGVDEGNLNAGKIANLYRVPDHEYFDSAFIDLTDIRPVRPQQLPLKNRIASTTREAQNEILQRFHSAMGRIWGYAEGEIIEALSKYETGTFRCAQCNRYDIEVSQKSLKAGSQAPECPNCKKIGKSAQWYPLTKHRKS